MRWLAVVMALVIATPALSLSCVRPDIARDFQTAQASEDVWIVVDGTLSFDTRALPEASPQTNGVAPPATDIQARITGKSLSPDGFTRRFNRAITLRVLCLGPWCGAPADGMKAVAFLKREAGGYVMIAEPCGGMVYPNATDAQRDEVVACFQGKPCTPREQPWDQP